MLLAQLILECNAILSVEENNAAALKKKEKLRQTWVAIDTIWDTNIELFKCKCGKDILYENDLCSSCYAAMIDSSCGDFYDGLAPFSEGEN